MCAKQYAQIIIRFKEIIVKKYVSAVTRRRCVYLFKISAAQEFHQYIRPIYISSFKIFYCEISADARGLR